MSIVMQVNPFEYFADLSGDALDEGYIWFGEPNKDPKQYPVTVYFDAGLQIPAAQPLRTSAGYITRNNAPAFLYINGNYSVLVEDKKGRQVFYVADFLMVGSSTAVSINELYSNGQIVTPNIMSLCAIPVGTYKNAMVQGYYARGGSGGGYFYWSPTTAKSLHDGGSIISPTVPWDGAKGASQLAFMARTGETNPGGSGCWIRYGFGEAWPTYWGADNANVFDCTQHTQAAVLFIAKAGTGIVAFGEQGSYFLSGTVLHCSNVTIDGRFNLLRGNRLANNNPMFRTATLESGVLVSNIASANETKLVENAHLMNMRVADSMQIFDMKNFIIGCTVTNIKANNCAAVCIARRCFYSKWVNVTASGGSVAGTPCYLFQDQTNDVLLQRVTATMDYGFAFTGGGTAITLDTCSFEGGTLGFYFAGEFHGVGINNLYAEAVQGTLLNFADCTYISAYGKSNYFSLVDVVMRDPEGAGVVMDGNLDQSLWPLNIGVTAGTPPFLYRGLFYKRGGRDAAVFRLPTTFSAEKVLPANLIADTGGACTAEQISVREGSGSGDVLSKGILSAGVIPLRYMGDTGRTFSNQVAFCTHQAFAPGNPTITILLDTNIKSRDTTFMKYRFVVTDGVSNYTLFGDIYGTNVSPRDGSGKTIIVSPSSNIGCVRLELSTFSSPSGAYTLTGTVQICS